MSQKPSGDSADELCAQLCRKTFIKHYPTEANMIDSVVACADFLRDKLKWRLWQTSEDNREAELKQKQKARPAGNKKAKQMENDRALVASIMNTEEKQQDKIQSSRDHLSQEVGTSMSKVGGTMDAVVAKQNQLKFAGLLSPASKRKFVEAMFDVKMSHFEKEKAALKSVPVVDEEVQVLTPPNNTIQEACEHALDDLSTASQCSSPGDNHARDDAGMLVIPEHLQEEYASRRHGV